MAETFFLLVINEDGTLNTFSEVPEELPEFNRKSNAGDVYTAAKQIVEEFDRNILVDAVTRSVVAALNPQEPTISDKVKEALKERNINPESVAPTA